MADITNLSSFLGDVADAIRTKKGSSDTIPAAEFDSEILTIETGVDTSDADATEENIEKGKTAYVNGLKVTGTLADAGGSADIMVSADNITVGNQRGWDCVSTTYTNSGKKIHKDGWYVNQHMKFEDLAPALGVTADKIVSGNTILGIEGTAETGSGTEINNQDKTITENGIYTADEGYTGLGNVTVNVQAEGIKQFNSIDAMHADADAEEDDMAIVYRQEVQNANNGSILTTVTFPATVVLPAAVTTGSYGYLMGDSWSSEHWVYLDASYFYIESKYDYETVVQYSSSDGITYTRGTSYAESYEFSEPVAFSGTWNDNFGYFIQTEGSAFDGLFQYGLNARTDLIRTVSVNDLSFDTSTKTLTWSGEYTGPIINLDKVIELKQQIHDTIPTYVSNRNSCNYCLSVNKDGEIFVCTMMNSDGTIQLNGTIAVYPFINASGEWVGSANGSMSTTSYNLWAYKLDLENMTYEDPVIYTPTGTNSTCSWAFTPLTASVQIDYLINGTYDKYKMSSIYVVYAGTSTSSSRYYVSHTGLLYPDGYAMAKTQFTLSDKNELLPGKIALGKTKVVEGDGSVYSNLDWSTVLSDILNLTPDNRSTTKYYGILPTKFISDIATKQKINHVKQGDFKYDESHYIGETDYTIDASITPTLVHTRISNWIYDATRDMFVSKQTLDTVSGDTTTYTYHLIFENATTHEILKDITYSAPDGGDYYSMTQSKNAVYLYDGGSYNSSTWYYKTVAYDLDTFAATTVLNRSTTYSWESGYNYDSGTQIVNDRFCFTFASWQLKSSTCYWYGYVYDDVTKKVISFSCNGSINTGLGYSFSNVGELKTLSCGNVIYVMCSWGYFDSKVVLYKLTSTSTSSSISQLRSSTEANVDGYDLTNCHGVDIDGTYLFWGRMYISKSSYSAGTHLYIEVSDTDGNILAPKSTMYQMVTVGEDIYVIDNKYAYRKTSYTFSDDKLHIVSDLIYKMPPASVSLKYITADNKVASQAVTLDYTSFAPIDNHTYTISFKSNKLNGVFTVTSYVDSTSLDCDCSVIYGGNDIVIMTPCKTFSKDYSGTITPIEYNTALNTTNEISGEEV